MNTFTRNLLASVGTASVLALGVQSAQAAITTSGCAGSPGSSSCTLQELFNGGSFFVDNGAGGLININNFVANVFLPGPPTVPSFSDIIVTASELVPGSNFSLAFNFGTGVTSTSAGSQFGINYDISSTNVAVRGASVDSFTFGGNNVNNIASLTKTATAPGNVVSVVAVSSNGPSTDATSLGPTTSLSIADVLSLDSGVSIFRYNQTFGYQAQPASTPEPSTFLGLGLLGLGALVSRKRKG